MILSLSALSYYFLSASAVLFYGIGTNKSISYGDSFSSSVLTCVKSIISASSTTAVSYLLNAWLLIPANLAEIYPFVATLIFILFSTFVEIFIGIGIRQSSVDFSIPVLSVFLALNEGISIGHSVLIACIGILSFYSVVIVFYCVRSRVSFYREEGTLETYCVLLLCLALVMTAIYGFNISWLNLYLSNTNGGSL